MLTIVFEFANRIADVLESEVRGVLAHPRGDRGSPASRKFLQTADVEIAVVEIALEIGHLAGEEAAVLADAVAAHRGGTRLDPYPQELDRALLGLGRRHGTRAHALEQAGVPVCLTIPVVHPLKHDFRLTDREHRPFREQIQVLVRDDRGDLDDPVTLRIEAGHLEVDPDQSLRIGFGQQLSPA